MASHEQQPGQEQQSESIKTDLQELIDWRESVAAGVGAWVVGIGLTYLVLSGFDVTEQHEEFSTLELSNWVFLEKSYH